MKAILNYLQSYKAPCLHCGSLQCASPPLCVPCFKALERFEGLPLRVYTEGPFPVYSFYEWIPGESDILSKFFLKLKGPRSAGYWTSLAPSFVSRRLSLPIKDMPIRIVMAPSSSGLRDHAYHWAEALAVLLEADLVPCLKKTRLESQRGSSLKKRQRLRLELVEKYSGLLSEPTETLWVFVDDILTSGSTAHAAYEALGSPPHFEAWVLGRRSLSCGASTYLL